MNYRPISIDTNLALYKEHELIRDNQVSPPNLFLYVGLADFILHTHTRTAHTHSRATHVHTYEAASIPCRVRITKILVVMKKPILIRCDTLGNTGIRFHRQR